MLTYFIVMLDNIRNLLLIFIILSVTATAATAAISAADDTLSSYINKFFVLFLVFTILYNITPNTKQAALIYAAPKIMENESLQETVKNVPEITKLGTDYLIEILKEKTEKKGD